MSLYGNQSSHIYGALRNAQLRSVYFPEWSLTFYIPTQENAAPQNSIPEYLLRKLRTLGCNIVEVDPLQSGYSPELLSWLAMDNTQLDYVLVRHVTSRLNARDKAAVNEWIRENKAFHCIRDHPAFVKMSIVPGCFGVRPKLVSELIQLKYDKNDNSVHQQQTHKEAHHSEPHQPHNHTFKPNHNINFKSIHQLLRSYFNNQSNSTSSSNDIRYTNSSTSASFHSDHFRHALTLLDNYLWPLVHNNITCHDSVSCTSWKNAKRFPVQRRKIHKVQTEREVEFIPAAYNEHHRVSYDIKQDNEKWWKPFNLNSKEKNMCQV